MGNIVPIGDLPVFASVLSSRTAETTGAVVFDGGPQVKFKDIWSEHIHADATGAVPLWEEDVNTNLLVYTLCWPWGKT
jgi:hypothetical protein